VERLEELGGASYRRLRSQSTAAEPSVASLSAARGGSTGRGAAGAVERSASTARAGSGAREPFSGADTLRVGVGDARCGGGTISIG